jgi:hypothetical protein
VSSLHPKVTRNIPAAAQVELLLVTVRENKHTGRAVVGVGKRILEKSIIGLGLFIGDLEEGPVGREGFSNIVRNYYL